MSAFNTCQNLSYLYGDLKYIDKERFRCEKAQDGIALVLAIWREGEKHEERPA